MLVIQMKSTKCSIDLVDFTLSQVNHVNCWQKCAGHARIGFAQEWFSKALVWLLQSLHEAPSHNSLNSESTVSKILFKGTKLQNFEGKSDSFTLKGTKPSVSLSFPTQSTSFSIHSYDVKKFQMKSLKWINHHKFWDSNRKLSNDFKM